MRTSKFVFLPESHEYYLDNVRLPSVTQILQSLGFYDYSAVPEEVLEYKSEIGRQIHKARDLYDKGRLDESSLKGKDGQLDISGYLESWKYFVEDFAPETIFSEEPLYSKWGFAGDPDLCATLHISPNHPLKKLNHKRAIIEAKTTTQMSPAVAIQTAGYQILAEEKLRRVVPVRLGVQLLADGRRPHIIAYWDKNDKKYFLSLVTTENLKRKYRIERY